jgi:hypothetical protein
MKPEDRLLFACTRQEFLPDHRQVVRDICHREAIDWDTVFSLANLHGVAPLVYSNLQRCDPIQLELPPTVISQFQAEFYRSAARQGYFAQRLTDILRFLKKKSIDVMVVKGVALGLLVYERPWYTVAADIDIVLRVKREALSVHDVRQIGDYMYGLEIEYDYFEHHDVSMNGILPVDFHQIWQAAAKIDFRGQEVWVMSPEDLLLSVCINSCRKRFFRLKALCDIAETVNRYPELDWAGFSVKTRAYECQNIVYTALMATKNTVGCKIPDGVIESLAVRPFRAIIIRYLCQFLLFCQLSCLYSSKRIFGVEVTLSLLLPYAVYNPHQIGRKIYYWDQVWRKKRYI